MAQSKASSRQAFMAISEIASIVEEDNGRSCILTMKDGRSFVVRQDSGECYEKIQYRMEHHGDDPFVEFRVN